MKILRKAGSTSNLLDIFVSDSSSTTGAGLAGLLFSSAGLTAYYYREGAVGSTAITLATMTLGTWATGGFIVIDGTNMPGCYQLGIPDAAFAVGAKSCLVMLKGATNMAPLVIEVQLTSFDVDTAGVTVTTNNDKTGYSLTQTFPANFASQAITVGGAVTAGTVSDKTGYSLTQTFPTNFSSLAITVGGAVTAGTVSDKTGYSLTQAFPANFSAMAITAGGAVTVGTNNDKTGYSLTQAFPTNFSALAITVGGAVTAGTVSDKTGYSLTQAFPANFSLLSINASGYVTYANDPWSVALPGTYGAGSAGYILGTNLNATVSSRSAPATAQTIDLTTAVSTFTGKPGTIGQLLYFIRQNAQNKLDFNKTLNNMILYEDDGITAKLTYAMTDNASDAIRGAGA